MEAKNPVVRERVFRDDRRFPELSPRVTKAADLLRRLIPGVQTRLPSEERIVHAVRVGLHVALESLEHRATGLARRLFLIVEKHVVAIGQHDKEVTEALLTYSDGYCEVTEKTARSSPREAESLSLSGEVKRRRIVDDTNALMTTKALVCVWRT